MAPKSNRVSKGGKNWGPYAAVAGALLLGGVVFGLVSRMERVPELPRVEISEEEVARTLADVERTAAEIKLSTAEQRLVEKLSELNAYECGAVEIKAGEQPFNEKLEAYRTAASNLANGNESRYLAVGDLLARRFQEAFEDLLEEIAANGIDKVFAAGGETLTRVRDVGGSFASRAAKRGVITPDGHLQVARHVPQVLFRVRWRHFARLPLTADLGAEELKGYYDFVVAFSSKDAHTRRVDAARRLGKLDGDYPHVTATALALYEARLYRRARDEVVTAIESEVPERGLDRLLAAIEGKLE